MVFGPENTIFWVLAPLGTCKISIICWCTVCYVHPERTEQMMNSANFPFKAKLKNYQNAQQILQDVGVSLNYCSQNGGNLYRDPYYNRNPNIGPRIDSNLGQSPCGRRLSPEFRPRPLPSDKARYACAFPQESKLATFPYP